MQWLLPHFSHLHNCFVLAWWLWQYRLSSFQGNDLKLCIFLDKNQHTVKSRVLTRVYNMKIKLSPKGHSKQTSNFPFIDKLKKPVCATYRDKLVLATCGTHRILLYVFCKNTVFQDVKKYKKILEYVDFWLKIYIIYSLLKNLDNPYCHNSGAF